MGQPITIPLNHSNAVRIDTSAGFQRLSSEAEARFSHARSISAFVSQVKEVHGLDERDVAAVSSVVHTLIAEGMDLQEAARMCVANGGAQ